MHPTLRRVLVIAAGIAAIVLGLVVLVGNPTNGGHLLAGAAIAAGVGLIVAVIP